MSALRRPGGSLAGPWSQTASRRACDPGGQPLQLPDTDMTVRARGSVSPGPYGFAVFSIGLA